MLSSMLNSFEEWKETYLGMSSTTCSESHFGKMINRVGSPSTPLRTVPRRPAAWKKAKFERNTTGSSYITEH